MGKLIYPRGLNLDSVLSSFIDLHCSRFDTSLGNFLLSLLLWKHVVFAYEILRASYFIRHCHYALQILSS